MVDELRARLARYPADRYPVQHATTQFQLGVTLANEGDVGEAEAALAAAVRLFNPELLPVEHAKALNALGAALRLEGRVDEAADAFARAAELFERERQTLEQGAALFNLGLVRRDLATLRRARELLDADRVPAQAAAAARELGAALLDAGEVDAAIAVLEDATELAARAGAVVELGAAANALGLAYLASHRVEDAIARLREAAAVHPRGVRPAEHAMAKANLALAYERAGAHARARLAARQALGVAGAPEPVAEQARDVLRRLGNRLVLAPDLAEVMDEEEADARLAAARDELARWLDAPPHLLDAEAAQLAARPDLAEAWLGALLELPTSATETILRAIVAAVAERERESFVEQMRSTLARFHAPQLMRVQDMLDRLTEELWTS